MDIFMMTTVWMYPTGLLVLVLSVVIPVELNERNPPFYTQLNDPLSVLLLNTCAWEKIKRGDTGLRNY